jgi:hypothetical protein
MISKEAIRRWAKNQNATLIGRAYDVGKKDDLENFVDWLYDTIEEITSDTHNPNE